MGEGRVCAVETARTLQDSTTTHDEGLVPPSWPPPWSATWQAIDHVPGVLRADSPCAGQQAHTHTHIVQRLYEVAKLLSPTVYTLHTSSGQT